MLSPALVSRERPARQDLTLIPPIVGWEPADRYQGFYILVPSPHMIQSLSMCYIIFFSLISTNLSVKSNTFVELFESQGSESLGRLLSSPLQVLRLSLDCNICCLEVNQSVSTDLCRTTPANSRDRQVTWYWCHMSAELDIVQKCLLKQAQLPISQRLLPAVIAVPYKGYQ